MSVAATVRAAPVPASSPAKRLAGQALRFATVGGAATFVHLTLALAVHAWLGLSPLVSNATAFLGAFLFSYAGHARWTFAGHGASGGALQRFLVVSLLALALGQAAVWLAVERMGLPFVAGLAAVVATVPIATFLGARFWAFAKGTPTIRTDIAASFAIVALATAFHATMPLNHDVAWLLTGAERLLEGGVFGRDVEDVTPVWAWWLLVPVAWAARAFDLDSSLAVALFVATLAFASVALSSRLLRPGWVLMGLTAIMMLVAGYDWAQREHLMAIAALPWILLAARRAKGAPVTPAFAVAVGALAAVGLLQKPHFLLVPVALECWVAMVTWRARGWRIVLPRFEIATLVVVGLLYVAAAWVFAAPWFTDVMPRMMVAYGAYANDPWVVVQVTLNAVLLPFLVLAVFRAGLDARAGAEAGAFLVAAIGAGLSVVLQWKGWAYHLLPVLAFSITAAFLALAVSGQGRALKWAGVLVLTVVAMRPTLAYMEPDHGAVALAAALEPGSTVMAFNTSPRTVHPAVHLANARWTGRAGNLHFVPAAVAPGANARVRAVGREQGLAVLAALESAPPRFLLVDDRSYKLGLPEGHDWLAWFGQLAPDRFPAVMAGYREEPKVAGYRVFRSR